MNNTIEKAFKSLTEFVNVEEPVYLKEEEAANTVGDLLTNASSYNTTHSFNRDGVNYYLYVEGTRDGGSLGMEDEFSTDKIDGVLVDVLDSEHDIIGTLKGVTLDTPLDAAESMAASLARGDEAEEPVEDIADELPYAESDLGSSPDEGRPHKLAIDNHDKDVDVNQSASDEVEIKYKDKKITVTDVEEQLHESKAFDLGDSNDVAAAKEHLDGQSDDSIEQIVDVSAESVDDLKKTYIGSIILRCPTCHTMIYKDAKDISVDDATSTDDKKTYNVGDECPHCGAKDGYELIGQVATLDTDADATPELPGEAAEEANEQGEEIPHLDATPEGPNIESEPEYTPVANSDENKEEEAGKGEVKEAMQKETSDINVDISSVDESDLDRLIRNYLRETYSNVKDYATESASVDDVAGKLIIEGVISFKSGKRKQTRFAFESVGVNKCGKVRFCGINETFSDRKAFTLMGEVKSGKLLSESLSYSYKIGDSKVAGRVSGPRKR